MNEFEIQKIFKNNCFIKEIINTNSTEQIKKIFNKFKINISESEAVEIKKIINKIKGDIIYYKNKIDEKNLSNIIGGKKLIQKIAFTVSRPSYYLSYGVSKIPMIAPIAYFIIKNAIEGFINTFKEE